MKQLNVSEPAATLYLQVLALHDPTTANIKRWNQWPTKELAAASAELVAGEYVVVAKRERAGREIFLPGGWEPLKQPNLPIETWKLSMFGHHDTERLRGGSAAAIVCEGSIGGAFRIAWKRVTAGDSPRYQDAITKKKKK